MGKYKWVLQAVIFNSLRRQFRRSPMYLECVKRAKREVKVKGKTKDNIRRVKFLCNICGDLYDRKEIACDHIAPVIPVEGLPITGGLPDFNVYISRLFCPVENLQMVCKTCHSAKSKLENKQRKELRDAKRPKEEVSGDNGRK